MKYFVLNGKEKGSAPEGFDFQETLKAHHAYVKQYFDNGTILFGGPKAAGCGLLVVKAESREWVREFLDNDPFVKSGTQDYDILEFSMFDCQDQVREWFA